METQNPEGYKKTEVGVIPIDWEVILLDLVAKRGSGHTPNKKHPEYWDGDIKWISLRDSDRLDALYIYDTAAKITPAGIANSSAVLHPVGTVVLSRDAGVGKSAITTDVMAVSQHFMAWHCGLQLDNHFLYYWLQSKKSEFERIAIGSTIKTIGLPYFKQLKIPLPPVPEQKAIAQALSDTDAAIAELDRLITKKRNIKQGATQQLLTGKKRLPGFSGEWEVKEFCDFACLSKERLDPQRVQKSYCCIELEHIEQGTSRLLGFFDSRNQLSQKAVFKKGEVLFGKLRPYLKKFYLSEFDGICSTEIWVIRAKENILPEFLFLIVQTDKFLNEANNKATGTKMPRANWQDIAHLEFLLPSLTEQKAIAQVLIDMDAEIKALEQKRDKYKAIKQGMMQELLTGRTRLV